MNATIETAQLAGQSWSSRTIFMRLTYQPHARLYLSNFFTHLLILLYIFVHLGS